jgi:hypothetical protein
MSQTAGTSVERTTTTTDDAQSSTGSVAATPADARQLEAEIERTREQLGETVQELAYRADVKSRARAKAAEVSGRLKGTTAQVRSNAAERVRSMRNPEQVRRVLTTGADRARERWLPLAVAAGVLAIGLLALSQWMRQHSASHCSR